MRIKKSSYEFSENRDTLRVKKLGYPYTVLKFLPLSKLIQRTTIENIFLIFHRKQDLAFNANNLHEMSKPVF